MTLRFRAASAPDRRPGKRPARELSRLWCRRRRAGSAGTFEIEGDRRLRSPRRASSPAGAHHGKRAHQPLDRLLHLQNRHTAAGRHQSCVAAELDGVAQALLGVEQHAAAFERLALPAGLREDPGAAMHLAKSASAPRTPASRAANRPAADGSAQGCSARRAAAGSARQPPRARARPRPSGPDRAASCRDWRRRPGCPDRSARSKFPRPRQSGRRCGAGCRAYSQLQRARARAPGPAQPLPCAGQVALGGAELAPGNMGLHLIEVEREGLAQVRLGLAGRRRSRSRIARLIQPAIRSGRNSTARRARPRHSFPPCSRSRLPRFIHAAAKSGRRVSARR